ncbi:uncharacterized protein LOC131041593 [Cryptomeria japonica]|uniref:uncharacterized protein LOC131041593 n=1 Tax=Cryptomeria japonica TaxID=3369 RepID=UPI0025AD345D|nr:uncharacterized protein LOC131041593 [Cryptomeria japonica]
MKLLSWNVRGINSPNKWRLIKHHIDDTKGDIWLLQETKWSMAETTTKMRVWKQWNGIFRQSNGAFGGLGIIWNPMNVKISLVGEDKYWKHCLVTILGQNENFNLFNVYGPSTTSDKRALWALLSSKLNSITENSCVVARDFNVILSSTEKSGGIQRTGMSHKDFLDFVEQNYLLDIVLKNGTFTWTNRRAGFTNIVERLD